MATSASSTRRGLLAAATTLPALAITQVHEEPLSTREALHLRRRDFVRQCQNLHHHGGEVALAAMAMELDPDACSLVQLYSREAPHTMPALHFEKRGAPHVTVVVHRGGAYEHGPVLW